MEALISYFDRIEVCVSFINFKCVYLIIVTTEHIVHVISRRGGSLDGGCGSRRRWGGSRDTKVFGELTYLV